MAEAISLQGLTKVFGTLTAVDNISLTVGYGEVLGFLGPNGAGKSTAMKMVTGFLTPTSGTVVVCGHDVSEEPVTVKSSIGYLPEGAPTYGEMTARKFLEFVARVRGFDGKENAARVAGAVERLELGEVLNQSIETLSKGFKRRVGLAQAILHDPPVLILDEPTDGLDPNQKYQVRTLIKDMSKDKAIIISTHILEEVEAVCTRAVVIDHGRLLADGTPDELLARDPHHNAVLVKVAAEAVASAREDLAGLSGVAGVETAGVVDGVATLRILPQGGASIALAVGDLLRAKNIPAQEVFVDKGSLDDVFRQITLGQDTTEGGHA